MKDENGREYSDYDIDKLIEEYSNITRDRDADSFSEPPKPKKKFVVHIDESLIDEPQETEPKAQSGGQSGGIYFSNYPKHHNTHYEKTEPKSEHKEEHHGKPFIHMDKEAVERVKNKTKKKKKKIKKSKKQKRTTQTKKRL